MSETEEYDEAERHLEALENAKWYGPKQGEYRIRISYNHESLWPQSTLTALKAFERLSASIVSKVGNARDMLRAEQRIQLAGQGVHIIVGDGECSCGLVVEIEHIKGKDVSAETKRSIVLSTPGHFDHNTRSFTDLFIAGETGPNEPYGYWVTKPGPLIAANWQCVYCGPLGEASKIKGFSNRFKSHPNPGAHERSWAALNVSAKRWTTLKKGELKHWAETKTEGGNK